MTSHLLGRVLVLVGVVSVAADVLINDTSSDARTIFQAGTPRSGTTFEFQVLCAAACLAHPDEEVLCEFGTEKSTDEVSSSAILVLKTHDIEWAAKKRLETPSSRLFVTTADPDAADWPSARDAMEKKYGVPIEYVQNFDKLLLEGHVIAFDYGQIFGLDYARNNALVSYMKYWEILRRCCGSQMSGDYRDRLQGRPNRRSVDDYGYDMCEGYDVGGIENLIMQTKVFRQCRQIHRIGAASAVDLQFDGTYCERAKYATAKFGWNFNDPRYKVELNAALKNQSMYTPPGRT